MCWLTPLVVCLIAAAILQAGQVNQPQTPIFRGEVRVVEIDAFVRDKDDRFVPGLTKDDFEVYEDDRQQEIAGVSALNVALDRRGRPVSSSDDVPSAESLLQSDNLGRVYVMVLNSSDGERVRTIAREFVDTFLGPTDLMAVMHGNRAVTQGLTNDPEVLRAAIDRYAGGGGRAVRLLHDLAVNLNAVRGRRKAILYIGDEGGISRGDAPLTGLLAPDVSRAMRREYDDLVRTAVRNNVRIYPVDPRGYLVRFDVNASIAESLPPGLPIGPVASGLGEGMDARLLASDTGGIAIVNTGNYRGNFEKIARANNGYYVIAFYSTARDGEFHHVKVRVKNRPDLTIRSRNGYRATAPDVKGPSVKLPKNLTAAAVEALKTSSPRGDGLPIEIFTAVFQGNAFDGAVLIGCHVPGASLKLAPNERVELSYVAVDRWGVTRAVERRAFTLTLSNELRAQVAEGGLRLFGRLRLPRGRYQIRVAASQPNGASGATFVDVDIPDYTELPMSVSDFVLSSTHGPTLTTLEDDAVLRRALPSQPTPRRRFRAEETVSVFGEIYNSQWVVTPKVGVTTTIQSTDGRVVHRDEQTLTSGSRGRVYYRGRVPLARFVPGEYRLVVEAYTRDGIPASASQQLTFDVD